MKKMIKTLSIFLGFLYLISSISAATPRPFVFFRENVLGTSMAVKVVTESDADAEKAEAAVMAEIERNSQILSTWDTNSEVSKWLRTSRTPVRVSDDLFRVLQMFDTWRSRTGGALDPAAEVICRLWKAAAKDNRLPTQAELSRALDEVKRPHWSLDPASHTATHLSDSPLVFGTFVKSYIINKAVETAIAEPGIKGVMLNIGGDLVVRGNLLEQVEVANPFSDAENSDGISMLLVKNRAVATSGNYRRGVQIGDHWYSHIVDPRTGLTADEIVSATVVAPAAVDAGALATAFSVLTPTESFKLAATIPEVDFLLVTKDGQRIKSKGWDAIEAVREPVSFGSGVSAAAIQTWDPSMELLVSFDLADIGGGGYRRPYVAVWVEDKDHYPVKTLALWYQKPRWLGDLRAWTRGDGIRSLSEGTDLTRTVSSATRSPGRYSLKWDGRDNSGKPVKPGRYTVFIEAAREHGTYQIISKELDFRGTPQQLSLPGGTEISAASLNYRKKQ